MHLVDLRSDTVTRPTAAMLQAMFAAKVGDDVFGEDPTINLLEERVAALFNKDAGLFCPSGTMCNQIAVKVHTLPLDEIIVHRQSHIYNSETGAWAFHSGVSVRLIDGEDGIILAEDINKNINMMYDWQPHTSLVCIENTCNKAGGSYYTLEQMQAVSHCCKKNSLGLHLDGARIFNALIKIGHTPAEVGPLCDSISVCLSKGLGTPVGSVLLGSRAFIQKARRLRKAMGGGMRQAGYLAAAGLYALDHNIERLKEDHENAYRLGQCLQNKSFVKHIYPVHTNIVLFDLTDNFMANDFIVAMRQKNIHTIAFGPRQVRMVTHLDFTAEMLDYTCEVLLGLELES